MKLYRVFPYDTGASPNDGGGALFVPAPSGSSRIDNPDLYRVLYAATEPQGAIAETFGRLAVWRRATFVHSSGRPYALATLEAPDELQLFDLNDVETLQRIGIARPTDVVTRDRTITQAWARNIFELGGFSGARWWSFYNPDWSIAGLWTHDRVTLVRSPQILTAEGPIIREAAATIVRQVTF